MLQRCGLFVRLRARASLPSFARLFFLLFFLFFQFGSCAAASNFPSGSPLSLEGKGGKSLGFQAMQSARCQELFSSCGELRAEDKDYSQSIPPPTLTSLPPSLFLRLLLPSFPSQFDPGSPPSECLRTRNEAFPAFLMQESFPWNDSGPAINKVGRRSIVASS